MTDRQVYEWLYRKYETPDNAAKIQAHEARLAQTEAEHSQKSLEQRKAEYWEMCRDFGCKEPEIQAQWEAYLRGEAT